MRDEFAAVRSEKEKNQEAEISDGSGEPFPLFQENKDDPSANNDKISENIFNDTDRRVRVPRNINSNNHSSEYQISWSVGGSAKDSKKKERQRDETGCSVIGRSKKEGSGLDIDPNREFDALEEDSGRPSCPVESNIGT